MNKITTESMKTFIELVYELTKLGLTFKADADTFTITLTGGY